MILMSSWIFFYPAFFEGEEFISCGHFFATFFIRRYWVRTMIVGYDYCVGEVKINK